jgi:hypothetical protein
MIFHCNQLKYPGKGDNILTPSNNVAIQVIEISQSRISEVNTKSNQEVQNNQEVNK